MRVLIALFLGISLGAAELEQITTADGRRFVGYYDADAQTMTIEGPPKAVIRLAGSNIVDRAPYVRPIEKDPIKRDEAAMVQMEAERLAAISDAARLRKFAQSRSGKESEIALAQANEQMTRATDLANKIDETRARIDQAKPKPETPATPAKPPQTSTQQAEDELAKAKVQAEKLREQAIEIEFAATLTWLKSLDLSPIEPAKLSEDPRQSEIDARNEAMRQTRHRGEYAKILEDAKQARNAEDKNQILIRTANHLNDLARETRRAKPKAK
jgi:hypothetical protein